MPDVPILPPGPSEEFLRRQAEFVPPPYGTTASAGSFDPSSGERQSQSFNVQPAPLATSEMQMLEAIRQQVNAMHFKNAQDALNASIQFQHMREAQRMRERGASEEQIFGTLGRGLFYQNNNPYSQARAMQELAPVPQPSVTDIGGVKVLRSGLRGERAQAVPQSAIPQPEMEPETRIVDGEKVIKLGPRRWQYIKGGGEVSASVLKSIYKDEISEAMDELDQLPDNKKPETVAKRAALQQQLAESRANRKALSQSRGKAIDAGGPRNQVNQNEPAPDARTAAPLPLPNQKSELITGKKYVTSRGEAIWDGTKFVK